MHMAQLMAQPTVPKGCSKLLVYMPDSATLQLAGAPHLKPACYTAAALTSAVSKKVTPPSRAALNEASKSPCTGNGSISMQQQVVTGLLAMTCGLLQIIGQITSLYAFPKPVPGSPHCTAAICQSTCRLLRSLTRCCVGHRQSPPAVCQCPMLRPGILTCPAPPCPPAGLNVACVGVLIADDPDLSAQHHCDSLCKASWAAEALHGHEVRLLQGGLDCWTSGWS